MNRLTMDVLLERLVGVQERPRFVSCYIVSIFFCESDDYRYKGTSKYDSTYWNF
jgi:hypothetical protein